MNNTTSGLHTLINMIFPQTNSSHSELNFATDILVYISTNFDNEQYPYHKSSIEDYEKAIHDKKAEEFGINNFPEFEEEINELKLKDIPYKSVFIYDEYNNITGVRNYMEFNSLD